MNNPVELTILACLRDTSPGAAVPERQLWIDVNQSSATSVSRVELSALLAAMEKDSEVFGHVTKDNTKWCILTNGRARLAEAGL